MSLFFWSQADFNPQKKQSSPEKFKDDAGKDNLAKIQLWILPET